jgi:hypothetical protein
MEMDWKKMGFKSEEEYKKFLNDKWEQLKKKLDEPEIKAVFKRLADR